MNPYPTIDFPKLLLVIGVLASAICLTGCLLERVRHPVCSLRSPVFSLLLLLIVTLHACFITHGGLVFAETDALGSAYASLARHLLQGDIAVDESAILWEAHTVGGKAYMYFGIFPALLRFPLWFSPSIADRFSRISCLMADWLALWSFALLVRAALLSNSSLPQRSKNHLFLLALAGFGLGSPLFFLMSSAYLYHEAILWGASWSLCALHPLLRLALAASKRPSRDILLLSVCAAGALLSRVTFGLPLLGLVGVWVLKELVAGSRPRQILGLKNTLLPALPAFMGLALLLWCNQARWKDPLNFLDFESNRSMRQLVSAEDGSAGFLARTGLFNYRRIPTGVANYFGLSTMGVMPTPPYLSTVPPTYRRPDFENRGIYPGNGERTELYSLLIGSSWLVLSALAGVWKILNRRSLRTGVVAFVLFSQAVLIFGFWSITQRFAADFLPLLIFLFAYHLATAGPLHRWAQPFGLKITALTVAASCFITIAASFHWAAFSNAWSFPPSEKHNFYWYRRIVKAQLRSGQPFVATSKQNAGVTGEGMPGPRG